MISNLKKINRIINTIIVKKIFKKELVKKEKSPLIIKEIPIIIDIE